MARKLLETGAHPGADMFHRILVPTDFSDSSVRALRLAVRLARESGARLTLLHCVGVPTVLDAGVGAAVYYTEMVERITKQTDHELARLAREEIPESLSHDRIQCTGFAPAEIVSHAAAGAYDLIVMGTHGRTGLAHVLTGSVAARVIQRAEVPVLVCR
jgi:nucleotide-binding universal stress UspA family protein